MSPEPVIGVDGARGGWIAATWLPHGTLTMSHHDDLDAVAARADAVGARLIGVDMPIGLPTAQRRSSDALARQILGPRRASLFPTPVRAVLDAVDHADAVRRSRAAIGVGISLQAWHLVPAIRAVRRAVAAHGHLRWVEVHPETTFCALAGRPLSPKRSPDGAAQRLAALHEAGVLDAHVLPPVDGAGRRWAADDVLDAAAITWSLRRLLDGTALLLGAGVDDDGYALTLVV